MASDILKAESLSAQGQRRMRRGLFSAFLQAAKTHGGDKDHMHAAAIVPDPKRGEQIVLVTEHPDTKRSDLLTWAQKHGVPEISVPKKIIAVKQLPVLGTGKLDYVSITTLAKEALVK